MDDLTKTLSDLQSQAENCSKSERLIALDFLKKLISNLENVKDNTLDGRKEDQHTPAKCFKRNESNKEHKSSLKLTIRKFKTVDTNYVCHECRKSFLTMKKLISHTVNCHTKAEITCRICKGTFYCYNLLIIHECICPKQTVFIHRQCGICSTLFIQKKEYYVHMKDEHMLTLDKFYKSFSCHVCHSSFQLRSQLLVHTSQLHKETCPPMSESTVNQFLKISQNSVRIDNDSTLNTNSKPKASMKSRIWCTVCKRNFLSQKALGKHFLSYMHKVNAGELKMFKKFVCDVCGNSFNKMICLQRHVSSHHNEFAHKCNLCDYRTSEKCNLTEHMRRHYQIRNFACEFCDARFIAKRELKDHVAFKHNSLRPFECPDCGKLFKTKRILRRHAKTHSEFRPYVCACGSNFLRMTNLRRHHLAVHHEASPVITKIQVTDSDQIKDYWYADSKFIKNKKSTLPGAVKEDCPETILKSETTLLSIKPQPSVPAPPTDNLQILNVNYIVKVTADNSDKDSKMYWSVNQNFLDPCDIQSANAVQSSSSSSLQDPSAIIEDSLNICDLVSTSPSSSSYPLLVSNADQSEHDQPVHSANHHQDKYKVESLMSLDQDARIWRPIDQGDDHTASSASSFARNAGLISSFNEVFHCYPDDVAATAGQWHNAQYLYSDPGGPGTDPGTDLGSVAVDNFLYYNQPSAPLHQSFAYIEAYSTQVNPAEPSYGGHVATGYGQMAYAGGGATEYIQVPSGAGGSAGGAISSLLFSQDQQMFHGASSAVAAAAGNGGSSGAVPWLQSAQSPHSINEYCASALPCASSSSSSSGGLSNGISAMAQRQPLRILSPIDFYVTDNIFSAGPPAATVKHEYCLTMHHDHHDHHHHDDDDDNPLIADFCTQTHQFTHNAGQLCSKNFSVVNLISSGCAGPDDSKDGPDDSDLLFSGPDDSGI